MGPRSDSPTSHFQRLSSRSPLSSHPASVPKTPQNTDRFDSPIPGEQNPNDSKRDLSLVDLQNLSPTVIDTYRIAVLETVGF